jgi:hypothetical protein
MHDESVEWLLSLSPSLPRRDGVIFIGLVLNKR